MIRLHKHVTLLSMATEEIAQEVMSLHPIEQLSQRTYSPRHHILHEQDAEALVESLTKQGYTVRVEAS